MFDKLVESTTAGAVKGRSRYFMVSAFCIIALFSTALVFSLYAADIGLGTDHFDVSTMLAPVATEAPEPPPPTEQRPQQTTNTSELPNRTQLIARIAENTTIPDSISVNPSIYKEMPVGRFKNLNRADSDGSGGGITADIGPARTNSDGSSSIGSTPTTVAEKIPDPPPAIKPVQPKVIVSDGVINGKATYLPPPPYPPTAKMVNAQGAVNVQVTIDETGEVISSRAVSGHPLLRPAAEKAAWNAKFSPTYLSKVPVKVTGIIVYNFKRN